MQTKRVLLALSGALLSVALAFTGCQREEAVTVQQAGKYEINFTPAKTNGELKALTNNQNANMVRTLAQFDALVADGLTPLSKLPAEVVNDFRDGLVFRNGGVAGVRFVSIKKMLTPAEFDEVMAVLGLDTKNGFWGAASSNSARRTNTAEDYKGYSCSLAYTCFKDACCICTSNC